MNWNFKNNKETCIKNISVIPLFYFTYLGKKPENENGSISSCSCSVEQINYIVLYYIRVNLPLHMDKDNKIYIYFLITSGSTRKHIKNHTSQLQIGISLFAKHILGKKEPENEK